jgi:hypothetical protein
MLLWEYGDGMDEDSECLLVTKLVRRVPGTSERRMTEGNPDGATQRVHL